MPALHILYDYGFKKTVHKAIARSSSAIGRIGSAIERRFGVKLLKTHVRSRYGILMRARWHDVTFQYCYHGTYGHALSDLLSTTAGDFVFLDIGANQGLYSVLAAKNPRCSHVLALEPVAETFDVLNENISVNGVADRVVALRAALSNRGGTAELAFHPSHSGTASLAGKSNFDPDHTETISLVTIEEVDRHVPESGAIIIKIDVEGHEDVVVAELARSRHLKRVQSIFYEIDEKWNDAAAIRQKLEAMGFSSFTKLGVGRHYDVLARR